MPDKVNVGFIGCGGNARGHMRTVAGLPNARLAAVCDMVPELAKQAAEPYGAATYTDHRAMLDRGDLHAVYISIPVHMHGQPEMDCISRGMPFLVEKPVSRDMATAKKVAAAVAQKKLITCVGYQLRYCGTVEIARETLAGKTVAMVVGKYWCGTGRGDASRWTRQFQKSGGQLLEQATHTIDLMRYLIGEVDTVYTQQASRLLHEIDCADVHCVSFRFQNGVIGSLTTSWCYEPKDWSNANVLDILYDADLLHWTHAKVTHTRDGKSEDQTRPGGSIDAVFVDAVQKGDGSAIRSPYSDAVKSLAVSLAAIESGIEGAPKKV